MARKGSQGEKEVQLLLAPSHFQATCLIISPIGLGWGSFFRIVHHNPAVGGTLPGQTGTRSEGVGLSMALNAKKF